MSGFATEKGSCARCIQNPLKEFQSYHLEEKGLGWRDHRNLDIWPLQPKTNQLLLVPNLENSPQGVCQKNSRRPPGLSYAVINTQPGPHLDCGAILDPTEVYSFGHSHADWISFQSPDPCVDQDKSIPDSIFPSKIPDGIPNLFQFQSHEGLYWENRRSKEKLPADDVRGNQEWGPDNSNVQLKHQNMETF